MTIVERLFTWVMTQHRSAVVVTFALPLSLVWDATLAIRSFIVFKLRSAPGQHAARVTKIVQQVRDRPSGTRLCTARPGWQSISLSYRTYKKNYHAVEMPLIDIVSVDTQAGLVVVEPFVTMGQLSAKLNPLGYTLPIVPEMDDLTVGGLINGTGIESSSHIYGLFHEICVAFELCLGDGTIVVASEESNSDLFHAIPWSYGTLGLLLSATLRIVPCKPYVRLTYTPFHSRAEAVAHFAELSTAGADAPDFVEGLAYSETDTVVMAGKYAAEVPRDGVLNSISWWWKPWFYKHVEAKLALTGPTVEYLPLRDYYHRHSRSMFWEMEMMIPIGNHPLFRILLGWLMPPKVSFLKLTQTEMTRRLTEETHVAQDFLVPIDKLHGFLDDCDTILDRIYPVWLCPHQHADLKGSLLRGPLKPGRDGKQMYVDVGVYGLPQAVHRQQPFHMRKAMREVEAKLRGMNGVQMLYADIFQNREEFEQMFDHTEYRQVREKYKAVGSFPEVFDKMHSLY
mmetsp:Transcript_756/g.1597  ORF Transcript_756/g.1597 Transcript_756/m.1597 type:complete len:510 (+) Transcript_756:189-1718(+)|eukprot:CAMPEP_0178424034 /NCGR_PEP_ID=MMETSP0689_2-20121128/28001_1 /TAXON_ID=160604 /ORGANISM="Amphidinium massartii, Strain CS-259" /LENGTH=509 /DNA_ID=CAMNT_0020045657 /DNA_START=101 /DNA_END=1630 /DNA_ORIENTATION=+